MGSVSKKSTVDHRNYKYIYGNMDGWMNTWRGGCKRIDGQMDGGVKQLDGWMERWMDGCMYGSKYGWMDGWVYGWIMEAY